MAETYAVAIAVGLVILFIVWVVVFFLLESKPKAGTGFFTPMDIAPGENMTIGIDYAKFGKDYSAVDGIRHGDFLHHHFRGELDDGRKFMYCPVGRITSWSEGDYDHEWCEYCKMFYKPLFESGEKE